MKFIFFFFLTLPLDCFAFSDDYFSLGLGFLQRDSFRLFNKNEGIEKPKAETIYPTLHLQYTFDGFNIQWAPELIYTPLKKKSADGGTESSYLGLRIPVVNSLNGSSFWTYGFSYYQYTIEGKGGRITLTNLNSPQDFDLPSDKVTTQFLSLDSGIGYNWDLWSAEAILMAEKIFSSTKRSFSILIEFKYNWRN